MKSFEPVRSDRVAVSVKSKDQNEPEFLRNEGIKFYNEGKFFEALESYNKSLCKTKLGSIDDALAYECRSVVYFDVNQYQLCLENIQFARDNGFPNERIHILDEREEKCKILLETQEKCNDDNLWKFFKLSYPPNPKIPFIINCLELHKSEIFGRYVVANQDLFPGDIIAIEEPVFKSVHSEAQHTRCATCVKSNKLSLIPSNISETAMFCSTECLRIGTKIFLTARNESKIHDIKQRMLFEALYICDGSFEKLKQLMDKTTNCQQTIFDFDLSDTKDSSHKLKLLTSILSLVTASNVSNDIIKYLDQHPVLNLFKLEKERDIAKEFLLRAFKILTVNSFGIEWVIPAKPKDVNKDSINTRLAGDGLCSFGSLMNHSCIPNIDRVFVDNKFVFYVRQHIEKGKQLFVCYGTLFIDAPQEDRQELLLSEYGFLCSCDACTFDYPASYHYPWAEVAITINSTNSIDSPNEDEWKKKFAKNCRTILKHQNDLSKLELCRIMLRNMYYLVAIAKSEPFIF
ncbi:CLUMA_CG002591, isoform A [Clunio marinus]|uniref:CLUMA_CG002591, isoform A n=1 Tax=Clunio marinus TaxID=568069 RepID=A0A1J1HQY3_9DIPT|nr:CLUMA_CG002591, isoform A [Clunio marinus]